MKTKRYTLILFLIFLVFVVSCAPKEAPEVKRDDFGCFSSCKFFPDGSPRQICEDWKAGKQVQWSSDCSMMQYGPCIQLCEAEKKAGRGGSLQQEVPVQKDGFNYPATNEQRDTGIPKEDPGAENVYIYFTDYKHGRVIRMEDMTGKGWVSFGSVGSGVGQFNEPFHLAVDSQGRVYLPDRLNDRIVRIDDMTGKGWTEFKGIGSEREKTIADPPVVRLDSQGRIYLVDQGLSRIIRVDDMTGKGWTTFGKNGGGVNQLGGPKAIWIDSQDRFYVSDKCNYRIIKFDDFTGKNWASLQGTGTGPTINCGEVQQRSGSGVMQFGNELDAITVDSQGRIYIADEHNNRIVRIDDITGKGWIEFSGIGENKLSLPHGITISSNGKIYIADTGHNRIVRIDDLTGKGWIAFAPYSTYSNQPPGAHEWQMEAPKGIFVVPK